MKNKLGEFKFILLIIFLGLYSFSQTDVKINLFTAPFLIPNFAFEIPTSKNQSVQLDVLASFWNEFSLFNDEHFLVNQTFFEYRWYKNEFNQGLFIGPNIGYGMFTFNKPDWAIVREFPRAIPVLLSEHITSNDEFSSGRTFFYGLSLGIKKQVSSNWFLEFFIGAGLTHSWYKGFKGLVRTDLNNETEYRRFNKSNEWLLYKGGLMLVYRIPNFAINN